MQDLRQSLRCAAQHTARWCGCVEANPLMLPASIIAETLSRAATPVECGLLWICDCRFETRVASFRFTVVRSALTTRRAGFDARPKAIGARLALSIGSTGYGSGVAHRTRASLPSSLAKRLRANVQRTWRLRLVVTATQPRPLPPGPRRWDTRIALPRFAPTLVLRSGQVVMPLMKGVPPRPGSPLSV